MAQISVKSPAGQLGTIDDSDLKSALSHGFTQPSNDEIDAYNNKQEYGSGILNPAIAAAESAAGTATFGQSRELENFSGLTTPEAQFQRAKQNPISSNIVGPAVGLYFDPLGAISLTNKIGGKVAEGAAKIIGKAPEGAGFIARAMKNAPAAAADFATQGAIFGAGNTVNEHALGDTDEIGEHLLSNVGYGALYTGGLGALIESGANTFGSSTLKDMAAQKSFQSDIAQGVKNSEASEIAQKPASQSIEDIQNIVKANPNVSQDGLPSSNALKEAVQGLPDLEFQPHAIQYQSLQDPAARDLYKTALEGQSEEAKALMGYEALQKAEGVEKLDSTIKGISPDKELTIDPVEAGNSAVDSFTNQYESEKKELAPLFEHFDKVADGKNVGGFNTILKLQDIFPTIGEYLNQDKEGLFQFSKYKATMPFSKEAHEAISSLVDAVNDGDLNLSKLRNVRESMRGLVKFDADPRASMQVGAIRKMLMDEMQDHVSRLAPDMNVREVFKRYAQNEERRPIIEKILGGSISDRASFAKTIKPEDVLNRLFSNTISVKAAKEILGSDFNKVAGDYLAGARAKVTDEAKNGFSSNKFATFLKGKQPELKEAFSSAESGVDPTLARIGNLTDYMRILPDSPSVNPSGTAKTLGIMEKIAGLSRVLKPTNMIQDLAENYAKNAQSAKRMATLNEVLAGKTFSAASEAAEEKQVQGSVLAKIERASENMAYRITKNAQEIFKKGFAAAKNSIGLVGSKLAPSPMHKTDKRSDNQKAHDVLARINELQNDPEKMVSELEKATSALYQHAPMITQGIQSAATRGTEFLATKLPTRPPLSPLSNETYEPSKTEIASFERYYNAVEDPMLPMRQVKDGSITPESVEAISAVYPKMYNQMKLAIMNEIPNVLKKKDIPYQLKQSLSMFLGQPIDQSLTPQSVMNNQAAFTPTQNSQPQGPNKRPGAVIASAKDMHANSRISRMPSDNLS